MRSSFLARVAFVAALVTPATAHAQIGGLITGVVGGLLGGGPDIVFDPTNFAKNAATAATVVQQLGALRDQYQLQLDNLRKLSNPPQRDIAATLRAIDLLTAASGAISYRSTGLGAVITQTFPGAVYGPSIVADQATQTARTLATLRAAMTATGAVGPATDDGQAALAQMTAAVRQIRTPQQAAELTAVAGIYAAQQATLAAQQQAVQATAQQAYLAWQVQREAQGAAAAAAWQANGAAPRSARPRLTIEQIGSLRP